MRDRLTFLLIAVSACSEPLAPTGSSSSSSGISFEALRVGDTLYVDQHSVGCFVTSDAHLVFSGTTLGVVVLSLIHI